MTAAELLKLDRWLALNVTHTLRPLSNAEYAEVVAECEEANRDPHPNLLLTQPYRFVGECPKYTTDPAAALGLLKLCYNELSICSCSTPTGYKFWLPNGFDSAVEAETLPLAIALFAQKLFTKTKP